MYKGQTMPKTGTEIGKDGWTHPAVLLAATNLSDMDHLLPFALEEAQANGAHLILMHVLAHASSMPHDAAGMPYYDPSGALDCAEKTLEPWRQTAQRRGIGCDVLLREGNAPQQIAAAVRQFHVDRVLLGTRSRSKLGKLLLGSVAEQVLRSVNLPVITVGPEAHLPVGSNDGQAVVLHATTLRETSRPSAVLAYRIASSQGAKLVLLNVLPPMDEMEREGLPATLDSTALHGLRALAAELEAMRTEGGKRISVEMKAVHGNPFIEILAEATEVHASLIVLGAAERTAFDNLTRDRTVYRVLAHARCPVLTLREALAKPEETGAEQLTTYR